MMLPRYFNLLCSVNRTLFRLLSCSPVALLHYADFSLENCANAPFLKSQFCRNVVWEIFSYKNELLQMTWFYLGKRFLAFFTIFMSQPGNCLYIKTPLPHHRLSQLVWAVTICGSAWYFKWTASFSLKCSKI